MAQQGRSALLGVSESTFPTNNAKEIKAVDHRSYNSEIIDSKFNWIDDEISLVWWDKTNNITLADYLNQQSTIIAQGSVTVGDIGGLTVGTALIYTGDFSGASVIHSTGNDGGIRVTGTFSGDYHPVITLITVGDWNTDNDVLTSVGSLTGTSFEVYFREVSGNVQNTRILISLLKYED